MLALGGWHDIELLSRMGLHASAIAAWQHRPRHDQLGFVIASAVESGRYDTASELWEQHRAGSSAWPSAARLRAALALARLGIDPGALAPSPVAGAAVRIALGLAEAVHVPGTSTDAALVRARLAAQAGDHPTARRELVAVLSRQDDAFELVPDDTRPLYLGELVPTRPVTRRSDVPDVSVIIPAHDAARTIGRALASLRAQTWPVAEVVLVDDASSDGTAALAERLAADLPLIVVRLAGRGGPYRARNAGLAQARGRYVTFLDSDDVAHPRRLERQIGAMQRRGAVVSWSNLVRLTEDGIPVAPRVFPYARLNPASLTMTREVAAAAGWFEEHRPGADEEYADRLRLRLGADRTVRLGDVLTIASHSPGSLTMRAGLGIADREGAQRRTHYVETWARQHLAWLLAEKRRWRWIAEQPVAEPDPPPPARPWGGSAAP